MEAFKILLADDDPEDRNIMNEAMHTINALDIMSFADNGEHALSKLDEEYRQGNIPDVIVLDLNMPKMGGTEALMHIKNDERFKDIPVIIYSTSVNPLEKSKCMLLGAHSYITKPVSYRESVDTARTLLGFCR